MACERLAYICICIYAYAHVHMYAYACDASCTHGACTLKRVAARRRGAAVCARCRRLACSSCWQQRGHGSCIVTHAPASDSDSDPAAASAACVRDWRQRCGRGVRRAPRWSAAAADASMTICLGEERRSVDSRSSQHRSQMSETPTPTRWARESGDVRRQPASLTLASFFEP